MRDWIDEIVTRALALQLRVPHSVIHSKHRLEGDLALQPLDVVLVVLRIEDELGHVEVPFHLLDGVRTVEDLTGVVRRFDRTSDWSAEVWNEPAREALSPGDRSPPALAAHGCCVPERV
jgi:hypothetical protein